MTHQMHPNIVRDVVELLAEHGFDGMGQAMQLLINECMKIERQDFLGVGPYQRGEERNGRANGFKPKRLKTRVGPLELSVPQVRDAQKNFYPSALEKGSRSEKALRLALAEMYVQLDVMPPSPVTTRVQADLKPVGEPLWYDLAAGKIVQQFELHFQVDGPIHEKTAFQLSPGSATLDLRLSRAILGSPAQPIEVLVVAPVPDGRLLTTCEIAIDPLQQGAVRVVAPHSMPVSLGTPPPAHLGFTNHLGLVDRLDVWVTDDRAPITLGLTPAVLGVADQRSIHGLAPQLQVANPLQMANQPRLHFSGPAQILLALQPDALPQHFFCDTSVEAVVRLSATPASPHVTDAKLNIRLHREAPAKKYIATVVAVTFCLAVAWLVSRLTSKLYSPPKLLSEEHA